MQGSERSTGISKRKVKSAINDIKKYAKYSKSPRKALILRAKKPSVNSLDNPSELLPIPKIPKLYTGVRGPLKRDPISSTFINLQPITEADFVVKEAIDPNDKSNNNNETTTQLNDNQKSNDEVFQIWSGEDEKNEVSQKTSNNSTDTTEDSEKDSCDTFSVDIDWSFLLEIPQKILNSLDLVKNEDNFQEEKTEESREYDSFECSSSGVVEQESSHNQVNLSAEKGSEITSSPYNSFSQLNLGSRDSSASMSKSKSVEDEASILKVTHGSCTTLPAQIDTEVSVPQNKKVYKKPCEIKEKPNNKDEDKSKFSTRVSRKRKSEHIDPSLNSVSQSEECIKQDAISSSTKKLKSVKSMTMCRDKVFSSNSYKNVTINSSKSISSSKGLKEKKLKEDRSSSFKHEQLRDGLINKDKFVNEECFDDSNKLTDNSKKNNMFKPVDRNTSGQVDKESQRKYKEILRYNSEQKIEKNTNLDDAKDQSIQNDSSNKLNVRLNQANNAANEKSSNLSNSIDNSNLKKSNLQEKSDPRNRHKIPTFSKKDTKKDHLDLKTKKVSGNRTKSRKSTQTYVKTENLEKSGDIQHKSNRNISNKIYHSISGSMKKSLDVPSVTENLSSEDRLVFENNSNTLGLTSDGNEDLNYYKSTYPNHSSKKLKAFSTGYRNNFKDNSNNDKELNLTDSVNERIISELDKEKSSNNIYSTVEINTENNLFKSSSKKHDSEGSRVEQRVFPSISTKKYLNEVSDDRETDSDSSSSDYEEISIVIVTEDKEILNQLEDGNVKLELEDGNVNLELEDGNVNLEDEEKKGSNTEQTPVPEAPSKLSFLLKMILAPYMKRALLNKVKIIYPPGDYNDTSVKPKHDEPETGVGNFLKALGPPPQYNFDSIESYEKSVINDTLTEEFKENTNEDQPLELIKFETHEIPELQRGMLSDLSNICPDKEKPENWMDLKAYRSKYINNKVNGYSKHNSYEKLLQKAHEKSSAIFLNKSTLTNLKDSEKQKLQKFVDITKKKDTPDKFPSWEPLYPVEVPPEVTVPPNPGVVQDYRLIDLSPPEQFSPIVYQSLENIKKKATCAYQYTLDPNKLLIVLADNYLLFQAIQNSEGHQIHIRPGMIWFLEELSKICNICIWSRFNLDKILNILTLIGVFKNPKIKINFVLDCNSVISIPNRPGAPFGFFRYILSLSLLWDYLPDFDQRNTIQICSSATSCLLNPRSGINIIPYFQKIGQWLDVEFKVLLHYLQKIQAEDITSCDLTFWDTEFHYIRKYNYNQ